MFELGDGSEDAEEHPADGRGGIDALVQDDEVDPVELQLTGQLDQVLQGPAKTVQFGDHKLVNSPRRVQGVVELGPAGSFPLALPMDRRGSRGQ